MASRVAAEHGWRDIRPPIGSQEEERVAMLSRIQQGFRSFMGGVTSAKAVLILAKNYNLVVDHAGNDYMKHIGTRFSETMNEHEMAVFFLTDFIRNLSQDLPQIKPTVVRYLSQAKHAKDVGHIRDENLVEDLYMVAADRFGVERPL